MTLLKQVKKTNLIVAEVGGAITVVDVKSTTSKEGREGQLITFIDDEGKIATVYCGGNSVAVGPATIKQTQWSADSKFGASVSTKIANVI